MTTQQTARGHELILLIIGVSRDSLTQGGIWFGRIVEHLQEEVSVSVGENER